MARHHPIEIAIDLARMPGLTRSPVRPPIPPNVIELLRVAAELPSACNEAVAATGESPQVVVQAARFYLQQSLFRSDADCYRILGLEPGASRGTARNHMRLLLQWLHPDRNNGLDSVYAERVLMAWRQIATFGETANAKPRSLKANGSSAAFHLPWIKQPAPRRGQKGLNRPWRVIAVWALFASLLIATVALSAIYFSGTDQPAAIARVP